MWLRTLSVLVLMFLRHRCAAGAPVFDVVAQFGAKGDGKADCTVAIDRAIEAAFAAGGGVVKFPVGRYLTGAVELKSRVTLELPQGAVLVMSADPARYPVIRTRWDGVECYNYSGMVFARDAEDVAITGGGTIDGGGAAWWPWKKVEAPARARLRELGETEDDPRRRVFGTAKDGLRPSLVQFIRCRRVRVEGMTINNAPMWGVHLVESSDVAIRHLQIGAGGPDTDGVCVDSSSAVKIEECGIESGGECVSIRSGRGRDGRRIGVASRDVLISKCSMGRGQSAVTIFGDGGAGASAISVKDCKINEGAAGIRILAQIGGGPITGVKLSDIVFADVAGPVLEVDVKAGGAKAGAAAGQGAMVSDVEVSNLTGDGAKQALKVRGLADAPVGRLTIRDLKVTRTARGASISNATGGLLERCEFAAKDGPALAVDRVSGWCVLALKVAQAPKSGTAVTIKNVADFTIRRSRAPELAEPFMQIAGAGTRSVKIVDCDMDRAKVGVEKKSDLPAEAKIIID